MLRGKANSFDRCHLKLAHNNKITNIKIAKFSTFFHILHFNIKVFCDQIAKILNVIDQSFCMTIIIQLIKVVIKFFQTYCTFRKLCATVVNCLQTFLLSAPARNVNYLAFLVLN